MRAAFWGSLGQAEVLLHVIYIHEPIVPVYELPEPHLGDSLAPMQNPTPFPHPEAEFRRALMDGRFLIQRCTATGRFVFYPRAISPWSGLPTLEWVPASGDGTVYSTTLVRRKPDRGGDYNVAMVALKEGPMMMSRIIGIAPDQVRIGQPVRAEIHPIDGEPQILFRPDETNQ